MPEGLDLAKFQLERYEKVVRLQMDVMKAYADFNYRMMEVAELQLKVETELTRLRILEDAFQNFKQARRASARLANALAETAEKYTLSIRRLGYLMRGETASRDVVDLGWRGFWFLMSRAQPETLFEMGTIRCSAAERKSAQFHFPGRTPEDAPSSITSAFVLMDWARKKGAVPKVASKTQSRLAELLALLGKEAAAALDNVKAELKEANAELKRVRESNWKLLIVEEVEPKTPQPK